MKNRIFASIIILLMIASASIAVNVNGSNVNGSGISNVSIENQTNLSENLNLTETYVKANSSKNLNKTFAKTNLDKNKRNIEVMRKANVPEDVINAIILANSALYISYTNPINGISTFQTTFNSNEIYTSEYVMWNSYTFYLPSSSYVNIGVDGKIGWIKGLGYFANMYIDNNYETGTSKYYECSGVSCYAFDPVHISSIKYLSKGYHTISVYGGAEPDSGCLSGTCYMFYGYMSIMAFPEYSALTVLIPNGYETWYRGQTKIITWKSVGSPGANVKIELYKAGVRNAVISSKTSNDGSYSWYIPTYQPIGTDYKIKITSYEDQTYYDWSNNNFKIY